MYLHADTLSIYLPKTVKKYKAFSDAGWVLFIIMQVLVHIPTTFALSPNCSYFIDTENIHGVPAFRTGIQYGEFTRPEIGLLHVRQADDPLRLASFC